MYSTSQYGFAVSSKKNQTHLFFFPSFSLTLLLSLTLSLYFSFWFHGAAFLVLFNSWVKTVWQHSSVVALRPTCFFSLLSPMSRSNKSSTALKAIDSETVWCNYQPDGSKGFQENKGKTNTVSAAGLASVAQVASGHKEAPCGDQCDGGGE